VSALDPRTRGAFYVPNPSASREVRALLSTIPAQICVVETGPEKPGVPAALAVTAQDGGAVDPARPGRRYDS